MRASQNKTKLNKDGRAPKFVTTRGSKGSYKTRDARKVNVKAQRNTLLTKATLNNRVNKNNNISE